ncbi:MFS general substrate transporter [Corynespora cassiicola Philippines]|uniref:MFS general substrate transporter n=1 Tax=Corynespora cassiicola Philippines TaxID=1448308 RepID=A0A2T2PCV4_CORCC|nr:MFS general substrate transporter [Corynespora cassiicola Philippines]
MRERQQRDSSLISGSVYLITSNGTTISLPIPSESRHDPLNWTEKKRWLAFFVVSLGVYTGVSPLQGASLTLNGIAIEFLKDDIAPFSIQTLVNFPTLFMGIGALLWVPLTYAVGRRPIFILAALLLFIACTGAAFSTTFFQLLGCLCLATLSEGFTFTVLLLIIIDLTFIHQRPLVLASVFSVNTFLSQLTLSFMPFITNNGIEWRRFYYIWALASGMAFLAVLFLFPETYFKRPAVAYDGRVFVQTASEKVAIYEDDASIYNKELPDAPARRFGDMVREQFYCARSSRLSWQSMLMCFPQIFVCFFNPLIIVACMAFAANFISVGFMAGSISLVLSLPPYALSTSQFFVVNMSAAVGYLVGCPFGAVLLFRVLRILARKNKGVREAEHYLVGYIIPIAAGALSILLYGLAIESRWHYSVHAFTWGLASFSFAAVATTTFLWITEAFPRWAAPAVAVIAIGGYCSTFAVSFGFDIWVKEQGVKTLCIGLMVSQMVTGLVLMPAVFWGKSLRQRIHGRWAERREGALRPF